MLASSPDKKIWVKFWVGRANINYFIEIGLLQISRTRNVVDKFLTFTQRISKFCVGQDFDFQISVTSARNVLEKFAKAHKEALLS